MSRTVFMKSEPSWYRTYVSRSLAWFPKLENVALLLFWLERSPDTSHAELYYLSGRGNVAGFDLRGRVKQAKSLQV